MNSFEWWKAFQAPRICSRKTRVLKFLIDLSMKSEHHDNFQYYFVMSEVGNISYQVFHCPIDITFLGLKYHFSCEIRGKYYKWYHSYTLMTNFHTTNLSCMNSWTFLPNFILWIGLVNQRVCLTPSWDYEDNSNFLTIFTAQNW